MSPGNHPKLLREHGLFQASFESHFRSITASKDCLLGLFVGSERAKHHHFCGSKLVLQRMIAALGYSLAPTHASKIRLHLCLDRDAELLSVAF